MTSWPTAIMAFSIVPSSPFSWNNPIISGHEWLIAEPCCWPSWTASFYLWSGRFRASSGNVDVKPLLMGRFCDTLASQLIFTPGSSPGNFLRPWASLYPAVSLFFFYLAASFLFSIDYLHPCNMYLLCFYTQLNFLCVGCFALRYER